MTKDELNVLIVDDSRSYQFLLHKALEEVGQVKIAGKASNGKTALRMVEMYKPDLITLDVEMPIMDGLETLKKLHEKSPDIAVIMVSALTQQGAEVTMKSLEAGAFDFIAKPTKTSPQANHNELVSQLKPKIQAILRKQKSPATISTKNRMIKPTLSRPHKASHTPVTIIGLGISTGGPNALKELIPKLPATLKQPIMIVQHMPPLFTKALADSLDKRSNLTVKEADDGETVKNGVVYIAPGGKQMKVVKNGTSLIVKVTNDPPEKNCKPSVDYLFRSLASQCRGAAMGVIMTGMGSDGTLGLKLMKRHGSTVIAQDEQTCTVFGMPMEAIKAGVTDLILPLNKIAESMVKLAQTKF